MSVTDRTTNVQGVTVPGIIYGTAWKKDRTAELVSKALQAGFRGFDTACQPKHYDEKGVGTGLQHRHELGLARKDIYLQTKFTPLSSQEPAKLPYDKNASLKKQVMQSFAVSQTNLQTDYVDTLLLHSPLESFAETMQAWDVMQEIHQQGGARLLGISNCYDLELFKKLYNTAAIKPAVVQNRFCKDTNYEMNMRVYCKQNHIIFESFWSLTANVHILNSETLKKIAAKYEKTPAQIFFRYMAQAGIVPLTGTSSEQHMQEDLAIFDFKLSMPDLSDIASLFIV